MKKTVLYILIFTSTLLLNSCKDKAISNSELLINDIEKKFGISISEYKYLCIINDGGCLSCDKTYSQLLSKASNSKDFLIIITENGGMLDLRSFDYNLPNIFHTYTDLLGNNKMALGSYFGKIENGNCTDLEHIDSSKIDIIFGKIESIMTATN